MLFQPKFTKVDNDLIRFSGYKTLSAYRVDSGCQHLGWVCRCEYESGGIEWMARTRDGANSTVQLTTKQAAAEALMRAYDSFCEFDGVAYKQAA